MIIDWEDKCGIYIWGVSIYAQTPEEIAISIVAELIKVKRETFNGKK